VSRESTGKEPSRTNVRPSQSTSFVSGGGLEMQDALGRTLIDFDS
jgi:hypothetical protein